MSNSAIREIWMFVERPLSLVIYLGIAFLAVRIFHKTLAEFVLGVLSELRSFVQPEPSARGLNALFGIFIFIAIIIAFAAQEVAAAQGHEVYVAPVFIPMAGAFVLILFFSLSVAYCRQVDK